MSLAEFQTPLNSNIDIGVALSTGLVKSQKYFLVLYTYIKTFLHFHFEQFKLVGVAIQAFRFRVAKISFYIDNPRRF